MKVKLLKKVRAKYKIIRKGKSGIFSNPNTIHRKVNKIALLR